jgi:hypothetical protein
MSNQFTKTIRVSTVTYEELERLGSLSLGYPETTEVHGGNDGIANILTMAITTKNNVNYQHQIIQKKIYALFAPIK